MSNWFQRMTQGIVTPTTEKKEIPADLWFKCPNCKIIIPREVINKNFGICECGFHDKISSTKYFELLFDNNQYELLFENIYSTDPLNFEDTKKYTDRLKDAYKKTNEAITIASGKMNSLEIVIGSMNFEFIGGSMGSVVGERIARAVDYCIESKMALMIISRSGGARMQEAAFSLMQMPKIAAKLTQLENAKIPYISLLTDPTTGGVTASYAMLGDFNIAEPGALIGFAGPRVIKQTIGKDLPDGFQTSEFLLEKGFLDMIIPRNELKEKISSLLKVLFYK